VCRRAIVLTLLVASAGSACRGGVTLVRSLTCSTTLVQQAASPDGAHVASLYRLNCGGAMNSYEGRVFLSDRLDTVNPLEFEAAQSVLYPYHADTILEWQDAQHLTVHCYSCLARHFKQRNAAWKDISLRYEGRENQTISMAR